MPLALLISFSLIHSLCSSFSSLSFSTAMSRCFLIGARVGDRILEGDLLLQEYIWQGPEKRSNENRLTNENAKMALFILPPYFFFLFLCASILSSLLVN